MPEELLPGDAVLFLGSSAVTRLPQDAPSSRSTCPVLKQVDLVVSTVCLLAALISARKKKRESQCPLHKEAG